MQNIEFSDQFEDTDDVARMFRGIAVLADKIHAWSERHGKTLPVRLGDVGTMFAADAATVTTSVSNVRDRLGLIADASDRLADYANSAALSVDQLSDAVREARQRKAAGPGLHLD